ncbi:MAG: hypothetical protein EA369_09830 [Bradymonadales bacterium]|nr:MAG: hypothetical protein EA369_09830 [Bradymonadales bacterium]
MLRFCLKAHCQLLAASLVIFAFNSIVGATSGQDYYSQAREAYQAFVKLERERPSPTDLEARLLQELELISSGFEDPATFAISFNFLSGLVFGHDLSYWLMPAVEKLEAQLDRLTPGSSVRDAVENLSRYARARSTGDVARIEPGREFRQLSLPFSLSEPLITNIGSLENPRGICVGIVCLKEAIVSAVSFRGDLERESHQAIAEKLRRALRYERVEIHGFDDLSDFLEFLDGLFQASFVTEQIGSTAEGSKLVSSAGVTISSLPNLQSNPILALIDERQREQHEQQRRVRGQSLLGSFLSKAPAIRPNDSSEKLDRFLSSVKRSVDSGTLAYLNFWRRSESGSKLGHMVLVIGYETEKKEGADQVSGVLVLDFNLPMIYRFEVLRDSQGGVESLRAMNFPGNPVKSTLWEFVSHPEDRHHLRAFAPVSYSSGLRVIEADPVLVAWQEDPEPVHSAIASFCMDDPSETFFGAFGW